MNICDVAGKNGWGDLKGWRRECPENETKCIENELVRRPQEIMSIFFNFKRNFTAETTKVDFFIKSSSIANFCLGRLGIWASCSPLLCGGNIQPRYS